MKQSKATFGSFFEPIKSMAPPDNLRANILEKIDEEPNAFVFFQFKRAVAFAIALLIFSFSGLVYTAQKQNPVSFLELSPTNFPESVIMSINGLSSDQVLNSLLDEI